MPNTYKLYWSVMSPFAQRVAIQLDAKGLTYETIAPEGGTKSDAFGLLNPLKKVPLFEAGDLRLPESEVICEYIEDLHPAPSLRPADLAERARARLIARISDLYVMSPLTTLFKNLSRKTRNEAAVADALGELNRGLAWLGHYLADGRYAVGNALSLADCAAAPILLYVARYPSQYFDVADPIQAHPKVAAYFAAVREDKHVDAGLKRIEAGWDALAKK